MSRHCCNIIADSSASRQESTLRSVAAKLLARALKTHGALQRFGLNAADVKEEDKAEPCDVSGTRAIGSSAAAPIIA